MHQSGTFSLCTLKERKPAAWVEMTGCESIVCLVPSCRCHRHVDLRICEQEIRSAEGLSSATGNWFYEHDGVPNEAQNPRQLPQTNMMVRRDFAFTRR